MSNVKNFVKNHKKECIIAGGIIVVAVIALACVLIFTGNNKNALSKNDGSDLKAVTAEGIIKDEEYNGLKFSNTTLLKDGENYTLTMDVTNTNAETSTITQVFIPIKDKNGNVIISLLGYIGDDFKANETRTITASTGVDLSKAFTKSISEEQQ